LSRGAGRYAPFAGALMAAAGAALLVWAAWAALRPAPPPYEYVAVGHGVAGDFPDLELSDWPDLPVARYHLQPVDSDRTLARMAVADSSTLGRVRLAMEQRTGEPLIAITPPVSQLAEAAHAIERHLPQDAIILAWWDISRQLNLLTGRGILFREHLGEPLLLPDAWRGRKAAAEDIEDAFWHSEPPAGEEMFARFSHALLEPPGRAVEQLRELAGDRPAYLVLHVTDGYKMGALHPDRFAAGYRDFPATGQMHGTIRGVRGWLEQEGHAGYTVLSSIPDRVRIHYLADETTAKTTLAQALPYSSSELLMHEQLQAVYQHGGFWIYRIGR